jgi:hypothetical protein
MSRLLFIINILYGVIVRVEIDIGYFAKFGYKGSNIFKILFIFKKYSNGGRICLIRLSSRLYFLGRGYK